jgi:hypothetical protein
MATPSKTEHQQAITVDFDVPATMGDGTMRRANGEGEKR